MKKNTFLAVTYGILPIATVSISLSSFAEEQLETINVEGELSAERQTQSAVEHKTASTLQKRVSERYSRSCALYHRCWD